MHAACGGLRGCHPYTLVGPLGCCLGRQHTHRQLPQLARHAATPQQRAATAAAASGQREPSSSLSASVPRSSCTTDGTSSSTSTSTSTPLDLPPADSPSSRLAFHHLLDLFTLADTDGNGMLDRDELKQLLQSDVRCSAGICLLAQNQFLTNGDLDRLFETYDADGRGSISFSEFMSLVQDGVLLDGSFDEYRAVFRTLDADGDGSLDAGELTTCLTQLGKMVTQQEVQAVMEAADLNRDARISFPEFLRLFHTQLLDTSRLVRYVTMRPMVEGEEPAPDQGWAISLSGGSVTTVSSSAQFWEIMQRAGPSQVVAVMCGLHHDAVCERAAAELVQLAAAYRKSLFLHVHVDASADTKHLFKEQLHGRAAPAVWLFRGGRCLHSLAFSDISVLEQLLRQHLPITEQPLRPVFHSNSAPDDGGSRGMAGFSMADLVYNVGDSY